MEDTTTKTQLNEQDELDVLADLDLYIKDAQGSFSRTCGKNIINNTVHVETQHAVSKVVTTVNPVIKKAEKAQQDFASLPWQEVKQPREPAPSVSTKKSRILPPSTQHISTNVTVDQVEQHRSDTPPSNLHQPISDKSTAEFIYDITDAEDIKKIEKKMPDLHSGTEGDARAKALCQELTTALNLTLDAFLIKRFIAIINAYLKGIRYDDDTKELLTRSIKIGGLGLTEEKAEQIIMRVDRENEHPEKPIIQELPTSVSNYHVQQKKQLRDRVAMRQAKKLPHHTRHLHKEQQKSSAVFKSQSIPVPPKPVFGIDVHDNKSQRVVMTDLSKPKMQDIKKEEKILGPVEELQSLTATDYRKLGDGTKDAVDKIKEKIDLLGEESFTKRAEAVHAWRQSPLYQLYLYIGAESMQKGVDINAVSATLHRQHKDYLSEEEFTAIADLNNVLRF